MAVTPEVASRSDEVLQRLTGLRSRIDQLVTSVRDGQVTLSEVFARADNAGEVSAYVYLVKVAEVLPGVGKVRARRVLEDHGLGERTRVGEVPLEVRAALVEVLT